MTSFNKLKLMKIFGLVAAILTGGVSLVAGNYVEGIGIISAALSSAGAFKSGSEQIAGGN